MHYTMKCIEPMVIRTFINGVRNHNQSGYYQHGKSVDYLESHELLANY